LVPFDFWVLAGGLVIFAGTFLNIAKDLQLG